MNSLSHASGLGQPAADPAPDLLAMYHRLLTRPAMAWAGVPIEERAGWGFMTVLLLACIEALGAAPPGPGALAATLLLLMAWNLAGWATLSGLLLLGCQALRRVGSWSGMLAVVGLSGLPMIFMGPLRVIAAWGRPGLVVATLLGLGLLFWAVANLGHGLRESTGLTKREVGLALLIAEGFLFMAMVGLPLGLLGALLLGLR